MFAECHCKEAVHGGEYDNQLKHIQDKVKGLRTYVGAGAFWRLRFSRRTTNEADGMAVKGVAIIISEIIRELAYRSRLCSILNV